MNEKEIELKEEHAIIDLPAAALHVELIVDVYVDGTIGKVSKELNLEEIRKAFRDAEDYIGDEDVFVITEKGKKYFESLEEEVK